MSRMQLRVEESSSREVINRQIGIAKDLTKKPASEGLARVVWNRRSTPILVP